MSESTQPSSPSRPDHAQALKDLQLAYRAFATPKGRLDLTFGCLFFLVVIAALVVGVRFSWLVSIPAGIVLLAVLISISNRLDAPHVNRVKTRIAELETFHALSHEESFELVRFARSLTDSSDNNEWKAFVTAIWGPSFLNVPTFDTGAAAASLSVVNPEEAAADQEVLRGLLAQIVPAEHFDAVAVGCWKSASSRAETAVAGVLLAGFGGGPKWYDFGLVGVTSTFESLYLVSFGMIAGAQVNDKELTLPYLRSAAARAAQDGKVTVSRYPIASTTVDGKIYATSVELSLGGAVNTEIVMEETFVTGNTRAASAVSRILAEKPGRSKP